MRGAFLRTWLLVATVSVAVALVAHAWVAHQMRRALEERLVEALDLPRQLAAAEAAESAESAESAEGREFGPHAPGPHGQGPRGRMGRGGHGRPEVARAARTLERAVGLPVRPVPLARSALSAEERAVLNDGGIVTRTEGRARWIWVGWDDRVALAVGPLPDALPRRARWSLGVSILILSLAILAAMLLVQRPMERRLTRVAEAAARLGEGDRSARSGVVGDDAVGRLGEQFDRMAEQTGELLVQREELLRSVSHELRTPLSRLVLLAEELEDADGMSQRARLHERMRASHGEMNALVSELLEFARMEAEPRDADERVDVGALMRELVEEHRAALAAGSQPQIELRAAEADAWVTGSRRSLRRALDNLIRNALRHAAARVEVEVGCAGGRVQVFVDDDGPGVASDDRERIFRPFERLGPANARDGTGLGLAIVRRAVEAHAGDVRCESSPHGGARFRTSIPSGGTHVR